MRVFNVWNLIYHQIIFMYKEWKLFGVFKGLTKDFYIVKIPDFCSPTGTYTNVCYNIMFVKIIIYCEWGQKWKLHPFVISQKSPSRTSHLYGMTICGVTREVRYENLWRNKQAGRVTSWYILIDIWIVVRCIWFRSIKRKIY